MSPTEASAAVYLDFLREVITSTTLSLRRNEQPVYEVSSEHGLSTTYVRRGDAPDSEPPLAMLARGALPENLFSTIPATMHEGGTTYTWKKNDVGLLSDPAVRIQDVVVISCLVLGQKLRRAEKGSDCSADAATGPIRR
ncbi:hypothetical protein B0H17DRAFT_1202916 [Mycena rosella]|uniref:Uncharacterized protein n=1 Tax=Mycena rosella TaxID=1033263 RepID=A0AAD7DCD1_MYCRO|nr:hypothetical protein B0H17DRAFT_1202916 [Mycena rosella]